MSEWKIGQRVTYSEMRAPGVIVGFARTRVLVKLDDWYGLKDEIKRVRPYRLHPEGEVGLPRRVTPVTARERASEVRRRIASGE